MLPDHDLTIITKELGRKPNLVEQGCFLNLWSEHCSYRSSAPLLKTFTTTGDSVIIGPGDDAAIVRFNDELVLAFGMESHNHPSYVDPYNGSATGVGGIVRDIISMGAKPIALMDPLYFGPLTNPKNLYLFEHIIEGIAGYGNCIGVPVVRGETYFHKDYSGNPLVNVVCVGLAHAKDVVTAVATKAGNRILLVGSTTGRDGLGGASFASKDLSEDSESADRPSIQIGDPFTEKLLIDATLEAIEKGYVKSCRDLGAAGLAGASSEMAAKGKLGLHIIADNVILREEGMTAYEILISESQERIVFEVEPKDVDAVLAIAKKYDLNGVDIGELTERLYYTVDFKGETAVDIPILVLTEGAPTFERPSSAPTDQPDTNPTPEASTTELKESLLKILPSHNIAAKDWIYSQYDHEVQIRTVVKPGSDSGVLRIDGNTGIALSCGCNPAHSRALPYEGGACAVLENAMNVAVAGGRPLALVNCLNFGNPERPDIYWQFKQSILGIGDMARTLSIPVVGGNVSLYNESDEFDTAIPPTPSLGMVGIVDDVSTTVPNTFTKEGASIILVGTTKDETGTSEYADINGFNGIPPTIPDNANQIIDCVIKAVTSGHVIAAHDISNGGLAVAVCEMAKDMGATININREFGINAAAQMFSESAGRALLVSDEPDKVAEILGNVPHTMIGRTGGDSVVFKTNRRSGNADISVTLAEIEKARASLTRLMME